MQAISAGAPQVLCWQNQQCRSVTIDILRSGTGTAVITYLDLLWRRWNQPRSQLPLQCASTHNTHSCWHQTHPSHGSTSNLLGCPTGAEFTSSVNPQITGLLGQGSDFSPASACGRLTGTDGFPELLEMEATHCKQAEIVTVVVGPMSQYPSCNNRASMGDLGSSLQTLLFAACTTFLPLQAVFMSQSQSSNQVCPLKPGFPCPASVCTSQGMSWEGECSDGHGPSVLLSLSSACCKLAGALSSEPLNLPICPSWSPGWLRVFPG